MKSDGVSRRYFFFGSVLAGAVPLAGFGSERSLKALGYKSPNEKLNIASIGAGGKAQSDIAGCAHTENIVALCDVDEKSAAKTFNRFPNVPKFKDYREMLDKEGNNFDACIVTIPDHMHATAAIHAMSLGKHVYVQKPLAHTVWECRELLKAAEKYGVATQMGNQGYSNEGTRQCAEMIWSGEIGDVTEVHAWTNRPVWPQGSLPAPTTMPVPSTLDWDLWLGIAEERPYSDAYLPFTWRGFFDFGSGALGDMACHILGAPNMALRLTAPESVECVNLEGQSEMFFPAKSVVRFDFPARGSMPPVKIFWYDAMREEQPNFPNAPKDQILGDLPENRVGDAEGNVKPRERQIIGEVFTDQFFSPKEMPPHEPRRRPQADEANMSPHDRELAKWMSMIGKGTNGSLFMGSKGMITTGTYGENTRLLPVEKMRDYEFPPELLPRSPGHYRDWIRACKGGAPACSNFSVSAPFTEWIALGAIATKMKCKIEWDAEKMKITNSSEANDLLKPNPRKGWKVTS
ncbi:MAG TPA: Gfo/Idh/MocA family oxidoreductase [Bryobacteraceae bacterium]|jgi:predicted dehydrogenase|nr:Gfo/Idh/MocA family oxidoreductase [Bryobacteraceae bacterium]